MAGFIKKMGEAAAKGVGTAAPFEGINVGSLGQVTTDASGRPSVAQVDPRVVQNQNLLFNAARDAGVASSELAVPTAGFSRQALSTGEGLLADIAGFDPLGQAEKRFSRLSGILEGKRDKTRAATEERLFRQGRLDSGFGASQIGEMEEGFANADASLLDRLFMEGEAAQNNALNTASNVGNTGASVGGGLFGELVQGTSAAQGFDQGLLQVLGASGDIGTRFGNREISRSNAINNFNESAAAGGGGGGTMGALGTLAGAGIGFATAGPGGGIEGATAGAKLGGSLGNLNLFT